MRQFILVLVATTLYLASVALAQSVRVTNGWYRFEPDGGVYHEVCGAAFKADGGRRRPEALCVPCKEGFSRLGPSTCLKEWKAANELP